MFLVHKLIVRISIWFGLLKNSASYPNKICIQYMFYLYLNKTYISYKTFNRKLRIYTTNNYYKTRMNSYFFFHESLFTNSIN